MKHESHPTKRQQWVEFSNEIQRDVNETLEKLQPEIEAVNLVAREKYYNKDEDLMEYINDAIEYLDEQWGYVGDYFHVTGKWYQPMAAANEEGFAVMHEEAEAFNLAPSNGFIVKGMPDENEDIVPVIGMSFATSTMQANSSGFQARIDLLAFVAPDQEVSLQYMRPNETAVVSTELSEVDERLKRADALLRLYINDPRSSFYNQNAKKQGKFFESLIDSVEDALPVAQTYDRLVVNELVTSDAYIKTRAEDGLIRLQSELKSIELSGYLAGVTLTDVAKKRFR